MQTVIDRDQHEAWKDVLNCFFKAISDGLAVEGKKIKEQALFWRLQGERQWREEHRAFSELDSFSIESGFLWANIKAVRGGVLSSGQVSQESMHCVTAPSCLTMPSAFKKGLKTPLRNKFFLSPVLLALQKKV